MNELTGADFKSATADDNKKLFIETYGCQMNVADSEVIASVMQMAGYSVAETLEEADAVFMNTCSIRDNAEQKILNRLEFFHSMKKKKKHLIVGVLGCMAERVKDDLIEHHHVDLVVGPDAYLTLPELIASVEAGEKAMNVELSTTETYRDVIPSRICGNHISGFVSIMRGCNNFCTYCIVPYTRGRERSRDVESILNEVADLVSKGYKEITLLGQNVNSYRFEKEGGEVVTFPMLLRLVAEAAPGIRVRFTTSHPKDMSDETLEVIAQVPNVCKHIHLPVQSGSSRILKLMNRKYTREWYLDRIAAIREMICSDTVEQREAALAVLEPMQQSDFEGIYEAMEGLPVTIRFLDPPLHEFVPTEEADIELLAKDMGKTVAEIKAIIASLHEFNPMMGHRGCRLAVTFPEIAVMQTRAVIRAAINVQKRHPEWNMVPEIMIPLVGEVKELAYVKKVVVETADAIIKEAGSNMKYLVGTMIEIPRAALTADEIATEAEFFSFGTNDLTQMTFGFSRDDAGKFLDSYYKAKIYESDPFARLDQTGVGRLVEMAVKEGRATRPELKCGICGEHGGDPSSVEFCHKVGLNYVSCSPFRVPIARLAAAQAALHEKGYK